MKSAQAQIRQLLGGRPIKSADERLSELMEHPLIRSFQSEHPEIPLKEYKCVISKLAQYVKEQENCSWCEGLETCKNLMPGHCSVLVGYEQFIDIKPRKCRRLEAYEAMKRRQALIRSYHIPKKVLAATFDCIDIDPERMDAINDVVEYCDQFEDGQVPETGLYLYGQHGVGKSYIAGAMANYLTALGVDVFMIYVPDFVQVVYDSIEKKETSTLLDTVKKAKVLIMDDIGAETLNPWMRDEIFGSILQYRMGEELPTVYTSNLTLLELEDHFAKTTKGGVEKEKAKRIMERIVYFVKPVVVGGRNRRKDRINDASWPHGKVGNRKPPAGVSAPSGAE